MLQPAIKYIAEIQELYHKTWFNDKYKYYHIGGYFDSLTISDNTREIHQFVSIVNNKIIGFIAYSISRETNSVESIGALNFTDDKMTFGVDLGNALKDMFEKYHFRKVSFFVVIGNPIEKMYNKYIEKYHGRMIGIKKEDVKLLDGKYYDIKLYEIFAKDYFEVIGESEI